MEYLVKTHRDKGISFKSALAMSEDEFRDIYPGYVQWRQAQQR
jgi:hypothetical protein